MATLSLDPENVRGSVRAAAQDNFFRGLVSSKLGSDRILDDELIDLIVGNPLLDDIFDDLCNSSSGLARIRRAVEESFPTPSGEGEIHEDEYHNAACRQVWTAAVDDPRFNIVLKQAQDEAKLALPVVRGSGLSGILGVLDKIRAALTSGASKHSDATLAGSVLAAILAGALVRPVISGSSAAQPSSPIPAPVNTEVLSQLTTALNSFNSNVAVQTVALNVLKENVLKQTEAINRLPQSYGNVITTWQKNNSENLYLKIGDLNSSLNRVENDVTQINEVLASTNRDVKTLQGQVDFATKIKDALDQIAYGIGPADQKATDPLPSLRKSSKGIADSLWASPEVATGNSASSSIPKALGSQPTSAISTATGSTPANGSSVAASLQTLAGIAKTEDNAYIRGLPVQSVVSKEDSTEIFERATDGAPCTIRWHLESHTADDVTLSVFDKDCQSNPPQNPYKLVVDYKWKQVQGTKSEVRWDRTERTKWWSLFDKSAVLALYRK
jgi:hypothetical protein